MASDFTVGLKTIFNGFCFKNQQNSQPVSNHHSLKDLKFLNHSKEFWFSRSEKFRRKKHIFLKWIWVCFSKIRNISFTTDLYTFTEEELFRMVRIFLTVMGADTSSGLRWVKEYQLKITVQKVSVFGVILVRIQSEYGKIPIRITPNKSTFHAVNGLGFQHASIRTYSMEDSSKAYLVRSQCFTVLTFFAVGVNMIYFSKSCFIKIGYLRFVYVSIATPLIYELLRH